MNNVTFADVVSAHDRLRGVAHRTPVITSRTLDERTGAQVFLKCENFQLIGAFKFRGAYNAISQLTDDQKKRGVITYSSGNHAQAVALVGRMLGVHTIIVMPQNAPATKRIATADYGAEIVFYNPAESDRKQLAESLAEKHGYAIVPPYDYPPVIAGQGTAALELLQDVPDLDLLLVCCGGGGLLSGSAIAAKGMSDKIRVIGIEPEVANDATLSFRTKTLHTIHNPPTIADGTRTPSLGELHTFRLVLQYVDDMQTVSEDDIKNAVRFAFYRLKLVIEPSGALGLSGVLSGAVPAQGKKVGVIISGGNIDAETMTQILAESHIT
ncbi:MAG: threo-3-hydroxy-L-aspartate ammonia-lyase [Anaerolineae bacterium]|jgi:threonine dehydratase|nr:threo-3-hydroxy-L-aspartate ammonia-lyase [Anaerolineae bacterium]